MDLGLTGRRAFVTGGARGIGAAICRELAAALGGTAVQLDVADADSAHTAVADLGTLDILVNNAGMDDMAFFTELTPGRWRPQLAMNLEGVLNVTHAALPAMQAARYGR